jgi:phosphatidylglycerophosphate synthase
MYSYKSIVSSLPKKKNSKSSLWVKIVVRKLSFPFTFIFINLGFSAWAASITSIFVALLGCILLSVDSESTRIIGIVLIELWLVLDCVDGNIARVSKTSSVMGEFVDALSGYFISGYVYIAIGIAGYFTTGIILEEHKYILIIMGAIASISNISARLIHQKYIYSVMTMNEKAIASNDLLPEEEVESKKGLQYLRSRVDKELGLSGVFMPFLIMAQLLKCFDVMVIFYALFSLSAVIAVAIVYATKANISYK